MKRGRSLVDYESSDEDRKNSSKSKKYKLIVSEENTGQHGVRRRRLPKLPTEISGKAPVDNPSLHQGRKRSTPHTDGQFTAYVYVPVLVERNSELWQLLHEIVIKTKGIIPALQSDYFQIDLGMGLHFSNDDKDAKFELHISLTRPIYLWHYQVDELRRAVKAVAQSQTRFSASFSTFASLDNDECSRTFLSIEIGAGHNQLSKITSSLNATLRLLHQKEFYTEPRYHASFAWALLDSSSPEMNQLNGNSEAKYLTIPKFPTTLVSELNDEYTSKLAAHGIFEVERVKLKIGKNVSSWSLRS